MIQEVFCDIECVAAILTVVRFISDMEDNDIVINNAVMIDIIGFKKYPSWITGIACLSLFRPGKFSFLQLIWLYS